MNLYGDNLKEGDVLMTNSPQAGGSYVMFHPCNFLESHLYVSHLPDITIITPVFNPKSKQIIFFTASRGHHADIGGILPGSMPPTSVNIFEEGAEIVSFKIVDGGVFDRKGLVEYMVDKPSQYPGNSGCRNIRDVESDLKAVSDLPLFLYSSQLSLTLTPPSSKSQRIIKEFNYYTHVSLCAFALLLLNFSQHN